MSDYTVRLAGCAALSVAGWLVGVVFVPAGADQFYKSVDAQGHVVYSDRPFAAGAKKTAVEVQQADPEEAARLAKARLLLKADDDQRTRKEIADSRKKEQQDAAKKQQCKNARDRYNSMKDARHIFAPGADGNREYYTDAQADAMKDEAKRTMDAACGT